MTIYHLSPRIEYRSVLRDLAVNALPLNYKIAGSIFQPSCIMLELLVLYFLLPKVALPRSEKMKPGKNIEAIEDEY